MFDSYCIISNNQSILQSIRPQYCELIAAGRKTIEVRKTRPKLDVPFKVYIYCTKSKNKNDKGLCLNEIGKVDWYYKINKQFAEAHNIPILDGKVIGEYVCDEIKCLEPVGKEYYIEFDDNEATCLRYDKIRKYGNGKPLYLWHISDLKIYDKPKELSEFYHYCGDNPKCEGCPYLYVESNESIGTYEECCSGNEGCKPLTHPPQSWCYVEEGKQ